MTIKVWRVLGGDRGPARLARPARLLYNVRETRQKNKEMPVTDMPENQTLYDRLDSFIRDSRDEFESKLAELIH